MNQAAAMNSASSMSRCAHLQVELLVPDRIEVPRHRLGSLLGLADLNRYVWIAGSRFVFGNQALGADN